MVSNFFLGIVFFSFKKNTINNHNGDFRSIECFFLFVIFHSAAKKGKKTKHGSVLRHVVLKNVSAQMVSASVSEGLILVH